jgi:hypothetical protein
MGNFVSVTDRRLKRTKRFPFLTIVREDTNVVDTNNTHDDTNAEGQLIYVALYDYKARTTEDLSFQKGEKMEIINNQEGGWWQVKSLSSGESGYAPSNYIAPATSLQTEK